MDGTTGPTYDDPTGGFPDTPSPYESPSYAPPSPPQSPYGQLPPHVLEAQGRGPLYDPGRPGPPVIVGILVLLLGPVIALIGLGTAAVSTIDIANAGPALNHQPTILHGDSTFMLGTPVDQPGKGECRVRLRNGPKVEVTSAGGESNAVAWGDTSYVLHSTFYVEKAGNYIIDCPKAGDTVLLVPMKGSLDDFGWALGKWPLIGALVSLLGLLMIIFRRKKPREVWA